MNDLLIKELIRSKEEKRILTGKISGIEDEYYKIKNENIHCSIIWYGDINILIPSTHLRPTNVNKTMIRGMLEAEIDTISNIAIASRKDAMQLRADIELIKLKSNDTARVRILAVGVKHIIVELYEKEVIIKADNLQHAYIVNCKELYSPGKFLKIRVKNINIKNNIFELNAKEFLENPYKNIRKYITESEEYTGRIVASPKNNRGIIVQLEKTDITCLIRVPSKFNNCPYYLQNVLIIRVSKIKQDKKLIYGYLMRVI